MQRNIFAYTASGLEPEFISINQHHDGGVVLTARSPARCGQIGATIDVPVPAYALDVMKAALVSLPRPRLRPDGIPTRCDLRFMSPAERAIRHAMDEVERAGASAALTDAVVLLGKARDRVADHVEGILEPDAKLEWPPMRSARGLTDGTRQAGSTGLLYEAQNGVWVRVPDAA